MRKPLDVLSKYCEDLSSWDAESQVLFAMDTYAAIQAVYFAKWMHDNCFKSSEGKYYFTMLTDYTIEELYQHWLTNIYLKQQGA